MSVSSDRSGGGGRVRMAAGRWLLALVLPFAGWVGAPDSLQAQQLIGRLIEGGSNRPVAYGEVLLVKTDGDVVDQMLTRVDGTFVLQSPAPGDFYIIGQGFGYKATVDGIFELGEGGRMTIEFYIQPKPVEIRGLVATANRVLTIRHLENAGFYERKNQGFGFFVTPDDIEGRIALDAADLLRSVPGVNFADNGIAGTSIVFARGGGCTPTIYIDGLQGASSLAPGVLDELVDVDDIEAIEVYTGAASLPLQFSGTGNACGVLLVWTKTGRRQQSRGGGN